MLILKQKLNSTPFQDEFWNVYTDMVVALIYRINPINQKMDIQLRYFKDVDSLELEPILVNDFFWTSEAVLPKDVDGNVIDWATFMATVPLNEWKDRIQDIGRVAFEDLPQGLDVTVQGFDFANNPVGLAWKQIMLFLPIHNKIARSLNIKFLDEMFEYATI